MGLWEFWLLSHGLWRVIYVFSLGAREQICTLNGHFGILSGCRDEEPQRDVKNSQGKCFMMQRKITKKDEDMEVNDVTEVCVNMPMGRVTKLRVTGISNRKDGELNFSCTEV